MLRQPLAAASLMPLVIVCAPFARAQDYSRSPEAVRSFYDVSPTVRWNRERYACAQLGLLPGSAPFGQCTASLDGAFLPNPN